MADYQEPAIDARAVAMDKLIRKYFDGCNEADIEKMVSCFTPDAVHYFPPGMPVCMKGRFAARSRSPRSGGPR